MKFFLVTGALLACVTAFAQHAHDHRSGSGQAQPPSVPYAGLQDRVIKALSDEQIASLRAGKGMALALAAELNGYPGPLHALELADQIGFTDEQRSKTKHLSERMKAEAAALGEQVIASEYALDRLFRDKKASDESVRQATEKAALSQAQLRAAHLRYHLQMAALLTPGQIDQYNALRGYR